MILAKCCHDLDIIQWLLGKPCKRVQSFGSLTHFVKENAPVGAPKRCADGGCPTGETCPYNCLEFYYKKREHVALRKKITKGIAKGSRVSQGQVIGYVGSQTVLGETDMMNIAVQPDYRKQGVAQMLISELIAQLATNDVKCLTLEVRVSNDPAISLYHKMGFEQVGRRPNYYHNPKEDALILRKEWEV